MSQQKQFIEFDPILQKSPANKGKFRLYLDEGTHSFFKIDDQGNEEPISKSLTAAELKDLIENNSNYLSSAISSSFSSNLQAASLALRGIIISDQLNIWGAFGNAPPIVGSGNGYVFLTDSYNNVTVDNFLDGVIPEFNYVEDPTLDIKHVDTTCSIISDFAFQDSYIQTIYASYVTYIGQFSFGSCYSLEYVRFPNLENLGSGAFYEANIVGAYFPKLQEVSSLCFYSSINMMSVDMPEVTVINSDAFAFCNSLLYVNIPKVTHIKSSAFYYSQAIESISFPNLITIEASAFEECYGLISLYLPKVETVGENAFSKTSLSSISLPEALYIGSAAFGENASLTSAYLPKVQTVAPYAFYYTGLTNISLPMATTIDTYAFYETPIQSAFLPNASTIESYAFASCPNLAYVYIPKAQSIGERAFSGCTSLPFIAIPSAGYINQYVFTDCDLLTDVYLNTPLSGLDNNALADSSVSTIHLRPAPNTPAGWTIGGGQTIKGKSGINVVADWTTYPDLP